MGKFLQFEAFDEVFGMPSPYQRLLKILPLKKLEFTQLSQDFSNPQDSNTKITYTKNNATPPVDYLTAHTMDELRVALGGGAPASSNLQLITPGQK